MLDIVKTSIQIKFKKQKNYPPSLFLNISEYAELDKIDFFLKKYFSPGGLFRKRS